MKAASSRPWPQQIKTFLRTYPKSNRSSLLSDTYLRNVDKVFARVFGE